MEPPRAPISRPPLPNAVDPVVHPEAGAPAERLASHDVQAWPPYPFPDDIVRNPVHLTGIVDGMEMQSDELHSYLHRPTGRVTTISDEALAAAENGDEEWVAAENLAEARAIHADDVEYLALAGRFEIDEYRMMERFAVGLAESHVHRPDCPVASASCLGPFQSGAADQEEPSSPLATSSHP